MSDSDPYDFDLVIEVPDTPAGATASHSTPSAVPATRPDLHDPTQRRAVEDALRALPGVVAARMVPGFNRVVDELHLVCAPGKSPKQIGRDVQSLLFARFGIDVDHRVISVVQVEEAADGFRPPRVAIVRVEAVHDGLEARVSVTLADVEGERTGVATGPASADGRRRAIARATLEALRPLIDSDRTVEIEGVAIEEVLGRHIALALVHFFGARGSATAAGCALVHGDESTAVARSVLDALNRDLEGSAR